MTTQGPQPERPESTDRAPAGGWVRLRRVLTVSAVDATVLLFCVALLGYVGGKLANGPHPAVSGTGGADIVVSVVLLLLISLLVLYVRALRRGQTLGQRAANNRRPS